MRKRAKSKEEERSVEERPWCWSREAKWMMMMTFITQGGEGRGKTNKKRKATKSKGRAQLCEIKIGLRCVKMMSRYVQAELR